MGVPAAKIIAKYGKKAYNSAKKFYKTKNKTDLVGDVVIGGGSAGTAAIIAMMVKEKMQKDKKKKEKKEQRTESRKSQRKVRTGERGYEGLKSGGKIKTYAKGSIVRKPKY